MGHISKRDRQIKCLQEWHRKHYIWRSKQQGQQQGGFLQNIEAKLNTIKNKVLELTNHSLS